MAVVDIHIGHLAKGVLSQLSTLKLFSSPVAIPSWEESHYAHPTLKEWVFLIERIWILYSTDSLHLH